MPDIKLFREDPEIIRKSQRPRSADVHLVDEVKKLDKRWRKLQFELDGLRTDRNRITKEIRNLKIAKADASEMISSTEENKELIMKKETEVLESLLALQSKLRVIGNLVHDSVPFGKKEDNSVVIRSWGQKRTEPKLMNHVELVERLGIADFKKGANVAGGRGYYLIGDGVKLKQALIDFGFDFLEKRGSTIMHTPLFMTKDIMAKCAQLAQFDEELYKVSGDGEDKYLINTAEQPLCAYHIDDWIHPSQLPLRYAGYSSCFCKDAGSHDRDTLGIFENVEQFCMTSPNGTDSWDMHEEMLKNSEDFYRLLNIPYQVVSIVSGALNDAAAKEYDLEGWFPASNAYRELVSCSNCTDYQSRRLEIRYGQIKGSDKSKEYVHMLNSTLTATERTMCCILENYQKEDGVEIPEALRRFMGGKAFIPFKMNSSQRDQTEEDHQRQYKLDGLRTDRNRITKEITNLKIAKADASEMISATEENKELIVKETEVPEALLAVQSELGVIRNLVHVSVPDGEKEDNNAVIRTWGEKEKRTEPNLKNHVELVELLGIADLKKGAKVAGGRGYYLIGDGAKLNQALINFGLDFLEKRGSTIMQTPFFMRKYIMAKCAQLAQFDEELYKVSGDGEDKYLIATSEQPLCAYHIDDWIHPSQLPLRYAGYSWCFRKEAGSHGRDTLGIFRVHEFQKVEQFCMTSPNGTDSWDMHEEMLKNSEDFYKHLNIPYQVVSISGALNDAAAKKYDLEGWFPASNAYRELVSCSNCIDNQSRRLEIRYGQNKGSDESKEYVHMLNCTLTATQRTMCCILENYQKEDGVEIPEALRGYMGGKSFIPFKINSVKETKGKKIKI